MTDLTAASWESMTRQERINKCRALAAEAETLAQGAHPDNKSVYLKIAAEWRRLAEEVEATGQTGGQA